MVSDLRCRLSVNPGVHGIVGLIQQSPRSLFSVYLGTRQVGFGRSKEEIKPDADRLEHPFPNSEIKKYKKHCNTTPERSFKAALLRKVTQTGKAMKQFHINNKEIFVLYIPFASV